MIDDPPSTGPGLGPASAVSPTETDVEVDVRVDDPGWTAVWPDAATQAGEIASQALPMAIAAGACRGVADAPALELSLVLTDDDAVRQLNKAYRGKDAPTNVLSFAFGDGDEALPPGAAADGMPRLLGDIVLARETVLREAAAQAKTPAAHASHLIVHGVLHLLGDDHGADDEAARMERRETEILAALGIDDPYDDRRTPPGPGTAVRETAP